MHVLNVLGELEGLCSDHITTLSNLIKKAPQTTFTDAVQVTPNSTLIQGKTILKFWGRGYFYRILGWQFFSQIYTKSLNCTLKQYSLFSNLNYYNYTYENLGGVSSQTPTPPPPGWLPMKYFLFSVYERGYLWTRCSLGAFILHSVEHTDRYWQVTILFGWKYLLTFLIFKCLQMSAKKNSLNELPNHNLAPSLSLIFQCFPYD